MVSIDGKPIQVQRRPPDPVRLCGATMTRRPESLKPNFPRPSAWADPGWEVATVTISEILLPPLMAAIAVWLVNKAHN